MSGDTDPEFGRLWAEADDLARRVGAAGDPTARYRGSDQADAVTVELDGDGRVRHVRVDRDWRRVGGAVGLGDAVLAAVEAAALDRLRGLDARLAEGLATRDRSEPSPTAPPAGPGTADRSVDELVASLSAQPDQEATIEAMRQMVRMVQDLDADLDVLSRRVADQQNRSYDGQDAGRQVTVRVTGAGAPVGVEYDARWLHATHEVNIGRATVAAFEAAYLVAGRGGVRRLVADSRIGALGRLAGDPLELARQLGLHRRS
ncbi:hypothetical protein OG792_15905 [Micromonospora sp. NBC_01699]|uniref:hypothetical protein n=1 Tax=Micromonospora sp. NBC_01699 TaxID=2975984 RepID=UPI002E37B043|nr:hypothetical protein [Micromonospora sp. NBC_01699]